MSKDPNQTQLENLRLELKTLRAQPLPSETRSALISVLQSLDDLSDLYQDKRRESRLAALYSVSKALGASLNLDEVLEQVIQAMLELTRAERGLVVLVEAGEDLWQMRAAHNFSGAGNPLQEQTFSSTVINTVLQSGRGVVTTDARYDPRFAQQQSVSINSLRSILCAPLRMRGQVIGAIYVDNRVQTSLFDEDDLDLLNALAGQAAVAIENARLYTSTDQALAQRVADLEMLTQIDRELNASLDLETVLTLIRRWAERGAGVVRSWVLPVASEESLPIPAAYWQSAPLSSDAPLVSRAWETGRMQNGMAGDPQNAYLVVPLEKAGRPLATLVLTQAENFREEQHYFVTRLASRAAAALENARLYLAVQQANQAKSKFVSIVSHELRIPMTSIKGYTDLLSKEAVGPVNEMQKNFLEVIRNNVERMAALVSDLSDVSRIETGRLKLELAQLSSAPYVHEVVQRLQPKMEDKQQTIAVELAQDLPKVQADPNRLVQVLTNLVSNAWKYTPAGGQIWIRVQPILSNGHPGCMRYEVQDTGIGISSEDSLRLFSQFFRSEAEAVRAQQGWGLGLNVTKRLVELMGGEIGYESQLDQGSTFWFTLPLTAEAE